MDDQASSPQTSTGSDRAGRLLGGRYRLIRPIATGGMAQVWEATDEVLVRSVAVKLLHDHLAVDQAFVERFRHEAIAAARLSHPSIVSIYDTVSDDGLQAIVMELVHGTTLRRRLDDVGVLDSREVAAIGSQVADALDTAHRAHVVHRDIKPANILLSTDGRVLVADFGIAKALEGADLTLEGAMLGTAKYLAPEQVEGGKVDGRTDLYSLGIVLYEALCGRVPFHADTDTATALARLHQAPLRPRQIRADIPRDIEDVVMRALARHPADRFENASQMRAELLACGDRRGRPVDLSVDDTLAADATHVVAPAPSDDTPVPAARRPRPGDATTLPAPTFSQSERGWLLPTLLIVLVAVALGVAGVLFGRSDTGHRLFGETTATTVPAATATVIPLTSAKAFDPDGDGHERDADAPYAIDGNPATSWGTELYTDGPDITRLKPGVGIYVTLDKASTVTKLVVTSPSADWRASVYASDGTSATTLADWGKPLATKQHIGAGTTTFDLGSVRTKSVLLWITHLPSACVTDCQVKISEMKVEG